MAAHTPIPMAAAAHRLMIMFFLIKNHLIKGYEVICSNIIMFYCF